MLLASRRPDARDSHRLPVRMRWLGDSLTRKFNLMMAGALLLSSLVFLAVLLIMYRGQLEQQRAQAVTEVNRLLQTALENAMLKRDLDGLREIVRRLGNQDGVDRVMILNPQGEVRFASNGEDLGAHFIPTCPTCGPEMPSEQFTRFVVNAHGEDVLRSVNPVRNKQPCTHCHGPLDVHPINGVLVVDSHAAVLRDHAWRTAFTLVGSGAVVMLLMLVLGWWFMGRFVLSPVGRLAGASRALSAGDLSARVNLKGTDELAQFGAVFDDMATSIQEHVRVIKEKEAFQQGLIDAEPDGIRVIDSDFMIAAANKTYCEQMGLELGEVVHRRCYTSSHHRDEPCPPSLMTCPLHEIQKNGQALKTLHQHLRNDGTTLNVEVFAAPMRTSINGTPRTFIVESIRDLDKQIQFSLEHKLATMGQLATGVAHEIHNPLASLRLAVQTSLRAINSASMDAGEISGYLRQVDDQIDHCIDITKRLLALSVPPDEHRQLVSLNTAIKETVSLLTFEAQQRGVQIEVQLAKPDVRVMGADSEIRMIVFNLVQNAFHAMPHGGCLEITTLAEATVVTMIAQDNGAGIRAQDYPHIFEPFFARRADGTQGAGLGLSICRSIVTRYGGHIKAESQAGEGARFTVTLPNADAKP